MNISTFRDAVQSRKTSLANDVDLDDDDEVAVAPMRRPVEGEVEDSKEKFTEDGIAIEPFNLKNEREGGYFDENQNYIFKKEVGEADEWIAGLDEQTIEAAIGEAALAEKKRLAKVEQEEAAAEQTKKSPAELKAELLCFLQPGETVAACLRRLSGRDTGHSELKFARRRPTTKSDTNPKEEKERQRQIAKQNKAKIDRVTEIADQLLASGLSNIYSMSFEAIQASTVMWEYKAMDGNIYGPYTSQQISEWKAQGFLTGPTAVPIRKVQRPTPSKTHSIYDDEDEEEEEEQPSAQDAKRMKTNAGVAAAAAPQVVEEEWRSSDDIDFGEFIDLDKQGLSRGEQSAARPSTGALGGEDEDENEGEDDEVGDDFVVPRRGRQKVTHDDDD